MLVGVLLPADSGGRPETGNTHVASAAKRAHHRVLDPAPGREPVKCS